MKRPSFVEQTSVIAPSARRTRLGPWLPLLLALALVPSLASAQATTQVVEYYYPDAIGSVRGVSKQVNGVWQATRHEFMPFGEELAPPPLPSDKRLFTGKERDSETGQDYFGARYYGANLGRFTTVDPVLAQDQALADPQLWNRYAYVRNNPLRYTDPDGRCIWDVCAAEGTAVYIVGAAAVATTAWLVSPAGQQAVRGVVNDTGTMITTAVGAIGSWFKSAPKDVYIDPSKYPEAAGHAADAQKAGQPDVLTVQRPGATGRRAAATAGTPTQAGTDRDEYPPAVAAEGGRGASVRNIPSSDNRGAGASVGRQIKDVPNGGRIRVVPKPKPQEDIR
jgi:RHS repeat-associated protein